MPLKRDQDFRKGFLFSSALFIWTSLFWIQQGFARTYQTVTLTVFELGFGRILWIYLFAQIWHWLICLVFYLETIHKRSFLVFRRDFFSIFRAWGLNKIALTGVFFFCVQSKSRIFTLKLILKWICRLLNIILWVQKNRFDWT